MNDKQIKIKERSRGYFTKGFFFLALMIFSLIYALYPVLSSRAVTGVTYYYALGGGAFAIFTGFFVFLIYKEFKPDSALILNARGFVDVYNVGKDIEIEWTNVASVKILGKKEEPFLGISLEDNDIVMSKMTKNKCEIMRENIEESLPSILVAHSDVRIPISELKDLFSKFIREARTLESDVPKTQKVNPFTTDDVLRAFGKLPEETNADSDNYVEALQQNITENDSEEIILEENETNESETVANTEIIEQLLVAETNENETNTLIEEEKEEDILDDEIPQEIKDILAMAKSSKITELEKILSENQEFNIDFEPESEPEDTHGDIESIYNTIITPATESNNNDTEIFEDNDLTFENISLENDNSEEISSPESVNNEIDYTPEEIVETEEEKEEIVVTEDIEGETSKNANDEVLEETAEAISDDNIEEPNEIEPETKPITNDIVRTNIPDLHFPDEFFDEKDSMIDTQEIKLEMNIEAIVNNAFSAAESTPNTTINLMNLDDIDVYETSNNVDESTIIEPLQHNQELQLDIDVSDDIDDSDGDFGFITDLD